MDPGPWWRSNGLGRVAKVKGAPECRAPVFQAKKIFLNNLTELHILDCELHKNAFGGRALPGPSGGAIALPQTL